MHDAPERLVLCQQCDWLIRIPARAPGQRARCPRCHHHLTGATACDARTLAAWAITSLISLALVFAFPFLGFSSHGIGHVMEFADTVHALGTYHYNALVGILLCTTIIFPGIYLAALIYICISASRRGALPGTLAIARTLRPLEPWIMSDVFIIGVLVSLVKIVSLANIHIYTSFIAFCVYALLLLHTLTLIDWTTIWDDIAPLPSPPPGARAGTSGLSQSLVACRACGAPFPAGKNRDCPRCGKRHHEFLGNRTQLTLALLVTAAILYIPANLYPIMYTSALGQTQPQTIAAGVLYLARAGDWPIAAIIFVASIIVPISKIVALGWLCIIAGKRSTASLAHTRLYRITEKIGRWSMIDVFVVSILATLVQAGALMSIKPGPGVLAFAGVVIVTMVAALTFDPRSLWSDDARSKDSTTQ